MLSANLRVKWSLEAVQMRHIFPVVYVDHLPGQYTVEGIVGCCCEKILVLDE
jgi:hypothetical protein